MESKDPITRAKNLRAYSQELGAKAAELQAKADAILKAEDSVPSVKKRLQAAVRLISRAAQTCAQRSHEYMLETTKQ